MLSLLSIDATIAKDMFICANDSIRLFADFHIEIHGSLSLVIATYAPAARLQVRCRDWGADPNRSSAIFSAVLARPDSVNW